MIHAELGLTDLHACEPVAHQALGGCLHACEISTHQALGAQRSQEFSTQLVLWPTMSTPEICFRNNLLSHPTADDILSLQVNVWKLQYARFRKREFHVII